MSEAKLDELVKTLAHDLDVEGWDQGARLYLVVGPLDDPTLVLLAIQEEGHPHSLLKALPPIPRELVARGVLGLALAMESWVVAVPVERYEEFKGKAHEIWNDARRRGELPGDNDLEFETWLEASWEHYRHGIPPALHPDRREARLVYVRTLHGRTFVVMHYRDGEEFLLDTAVGDHALTGRMEEQMQRLTSEIEGRN